MAKATLYAHFSSKDELILAYLGRADVAWQGKLRAAADAAGPDPRDQLSGLFDALRDACMRPGYRGCAFINTAAEAAPGGPVHAATVAHKLAVRAWVTELARLAAATDPAALARALTVLLDGALAATALEPHAELAEQTRQAASTLIDAACPARETAGGRPPTLNPAT